MRYSHIIGRLSKNENILILHSTRRMSVTVQAGFLDGGSFRVLKLEHFLDFCPRLISSKLPS